MSKNISSITNKLPTANEGFYTTTSSTVSAGAATVGLNSTSGLVNGSVFVGIIEPAAANQQTFTGVVDTTGNQITSVVWTRGNDVSHAAGSTIVDYVSGTGFNMLSSAMQGVMNQNGTFKTSAVQASLGLTNLNGYTPVGYAPNTVTANGNRSYDMVFNGQDLTSFLSPGMRLRTTRTVAAPTQSASLNGTNQYFNKTAPAGMTFTDDFTVSAWVKLSSYQVSMVASRRDGTQGWQMFVNSSGQINMSGFNAGLANFSQILSAQSIPLNKWVHIAAQLDMSAFTATTTTSYVMIDGVDVPASVSRSGTNPTSLVQAGNLEIGSVANSQYFAGKLAQVAIYSAKVTQATIRSYMNQGLTGSETNLISAYSLSNSLTDLNTTNANNLTNNNGATTTSADAPFGGQADGTISSTLDYAIVQKATFSTNTTVTVQVPEGCTIPTSGGVSAVVYSSNKSPYGFALDSKFPISVYDSTIAASLVATGINKPVDHIKYTNSGTAGGTYYLNQVGSVKTITGLTNQCSALPTNGSTSLFVIYPLTFTVTPDVVVCSGYQTVDVRVMCSASTNTTTQLLIQYTSLNATANAACSGLYIITGV